MPCTRTVCMCVYRSVHLHVLYVLVCMFVCLSTAVCFLPQSASVVAFLALNAGSPPPVACDIGSWHPCVYSKRRRTQALPETFVPSKKEEVFVLLSLLGNCPLFLLSGSWPHWKHSPVHNRCLFYIDSALLCLGHKNSILMEAVVHMSHFAVETVVGWLYQQQKPDPLFKEILLSTLSPMLAPEGSNSLKKPLLKEQKQGEIY